MCERSDLLKKLVVNGHVDMTERQALGVVGRKEVAETVKSLLRLNGVFPDHREAKAVYEGATLVEVPEGVEITWSGHILGIRSRRQNAALRQSMTRTLQ
jgi:hypothetical protein